MGTPYKNSGSFESPYATPMQQQYPSQSEDYLSFDMGGPSQSTPAKKQDAVPHFYQNRSNQNRGGYGQNRFNNNYGRNSYGGGGGGQNRQNFHQQKRQHQNQRGSWSAHKMRPELEKGNTFSQYFHPTMLEDPWADLMKRQNALRQSEIQETKSKQQEDIAENSSEDDNDADDTLNKTLSP